MQKSILECLSKKFNFDINIANKFLKKTKSTITLTFGDVAENHIGNQTIGELSQKGFNINDLIQIKNIFESFGLECELIRLDKNINKDLDAGILIIRNGIKYFDVNDYSLFNKMLKLNWDKKFKCMRRNKVLNKRARYNLCFGEENQEPNYEEGKGRIYKFNFIEDLNKIREKLQILGDDFKNLQCEGNYYYNLKSYIGFHGDKERKKVFALRLGEPMNLKYQWYKYSKKIGDEIKFILNSGDCYCMTEKAVGCDWLKKNIYTIRHCANFDNIG